MTVQSEITRADYEGNGVTVLFSVPFRFLADSHLKVLRTVIATNVTTELILNSLGPDGYSVSGAGKPSGGFITTVTAPAGTDPTPALATRLSILRDVPITQLTDYIANDAFPAESHEAALDKLTMILQQQGEVVDRAIVLSPQSVGVSNILPGPEALKLLRWKPDLSGLENATPPQIATVADGAVTDITVSPIAGIQSTKLAYQQAGTGATVRSVQSKLRERVSFEDYGAVGDGVTDDTAAIQAAIDANPNKDIFATKAAYKITAAIQILTAVKLHAPEGGAEIRQFTTNASHIIIGDGTLGGKTSSTGTEIDGFTFVPGSGVSNFTSGSCLFFNYTALPYVHDCDFYGRDGTNTTRLFRAITMFQTQIGTVRHCRMRYMRDSLIFTSGSAGIANRTVDIHFESLYINSPGNHAVNLNANSAGIFLSDCTILDVGPFDAININSDPATENGTNFFINNINIEGGNYVGGRGIVVSKGSIVQIIGGWIGGIVAAQPAVWFGPSASSCEMTGCRVDFGGILVEGAACSVKSCEISGDNSLTAQGIRVTATASDFLIAASRVSRFTANGIAITGTPARGVISGVQFSNIGAGIITGANYATGPSITGIRSNALATATSAATISLDFGPDTYQVTGTTPNITDINPKASGRRIIVQAGTGGITLSNAGAVILLKGGAATVTIPQFRTIELFCDGVNWFEIGGNY